MLHYCELIADRQRLLSAFNQAPEVMWTSVISYDELISQIYDDLDALRMSKQLGDSDLPQPLSGSLRSFVEALYVFDKGVRGEWQPQFDTPVWARVEVAARDALDAAKSWTNV